jgi:membrane protein
MDKIKLVGKMFFLAFKDLFEDNGPYWAAAIAYFALLSFFPMMLAGVSIASFFTDEEWAVEQLTDIVGDFLPEGEEMLSDTVSGVIETRGTTSIVSILLLLWTGSRVFGVFVKALNQTYDIVDTYDFMRQRLAELIMTLTLGTFIVLAFASEYVLGYILRQTGILGDNQNMIFSILLSVIPVILLFISFFLIYRFVPRRDVDNRAALAGAFVALVIILIARPLFLGYINDLVDYNLVYGSLAIVVILLFWVWIVSMLILYGGEFTAEIQKYIIDGKSEEELEEKDKVGGISK